MKKLALALSIACAGALAFADNPQWNTSAWITGIGSSISGITDTGLGVVNGSWGETLTSDNAEISDGALVLDLDTDDEALFTVSADTTEKTAQRLTISGVFTPTTADDLLTGTQMGQSGKKAQFGFAVVSTTSTSEASDNSEATDNTETATSTTTTSYGYYAWIGGNNSGDAIADWTKLGDCTDPTVSITVTIAASYWAGSPKVQFTITEGNSTTAIESNELTLTGDAATAAAANKIASIACTGSGTLSSLEGVTGIAVASIGDVSYGTVAAAITAAKDSDTVTLVTAPDGNVEIPSTSTAKIDPNGKSTANIVNNGTMSIEVKDTAEGASSGSVPSGTYTYTVSTTGSGSYAATVDDSSKEVVSTTKNTDGTVTVTVQTAKTVLEAVTVGGNNTTLMTNEAKFREFLKDYCTDAYTKGNTSNGDIQTALNEKATISDNQTNDLTKWQCYALGISPTTTLETAYAESDSSTDAITIALKPSNADESITSSGDFTINYTVTGNNDATTTVTDSSAIQVPLTKTGRYSVNVVFAPKSSSEQ